jgi:hypothetical protein
MLAGRFTFGTVVSIKFLLKVRHVLNFESLTDDGGPIKDPDVKNERLNQAPVYSRSR